MGKLILYVDLLFRNRLQIVGQYMWFSICLVNYNHFIVQNKERRINKSYLYEYLMQKSLYTVCYGLMEPFYHCAVKCEFLFHLSTPMHWHTSVPNIIFQLA